MLKKEPRFRTNFIMARQSITVISQLSILLKNGDDSDLELQKGYISY